MFRIAGVNPNGYADARNQRSSGEGWSNQGAAVPDGLILSSDSHVFEPPDLWTQRIDDAFKSRAPRMKRIGDVDHLVVEDKC